MKRAEECFFDRRRTFISVYEQMIPVFEHAMKSSSKINYLDVRYFILVR